MGQIGALGSTAAGTATTPEMHQQSIAADFVNTDKSPIIKGGAVSGRGDLSYAYTAGVGLVTTPSGAVRATWAAGNTALVTSPSADRTDVIYADEVGMVKVAPGGAGLPTNACILDKRLLKAGSSNTSTAASAWNRLYALPYGAQLGWLSMFIETYAQGQAVPKNRVTWITQKFFVPTDRDVQVRMHQCIYGTHNASAPSTDYSQAGRGSMKYYLYLDNVLKRVWEIGYDRVWEVKMHNVDLTVTEGEHTIRLEREKVWGIADPLYFGSPDNIWQPGSCGVHDEGVAE